MPPVYRIIYVSSRHPLFSAEKQPQFLLQLRTDVASLTSAVVMPNENLAGYHSYILVDDKLNPNHIGKVLFAVTRTLFKYTCSEAKPGDRSISSPGRLRWTNVEDRISIGYDLSDDMFNWLLALSSSDRDRIADEVVRNMREVVSLFWTAKSEELSVRCEINDDGHFVMRCPGDESSLSLESSTNRRYGHTFVGHNEDGEYQRLTLLAGLCTLIQHFEEKR